MTNEQSGNRRRNKRKILEMLEGGLKIKEGIRRPKKLGKRVGKLGRRENGYSSWDEYREVTNGVMVNDDYDIGIGDVGYEGLTEWDLGI